MLYCQMEIYALYFLLSTGGMYDKSRKIENNYGVRD